MAKPVFKKKKANGFLQMILLTFRQWNGKLSKDLVTISVYGKECIIEPSISTQIKHLLPLSPQGIGPVIEKFVN